MKLFKLHLPKMKVGALMLGLLLGMAGMSLGQGGKISGTVLFDGDLSPGVPVKLYKGERYIGGTLSDADGKYEFANLESGRYRVYSGYEGQEFERTIVLGTGAGERVAVILDPKDVVINPDGLLFTLSPENPTVIDGRQMQDMGFRNPLDAVASMTPGVFQADQGDPLQFRGGRQGQELIIVNGQKVRGTLSVPQKAVGTMTVLTGGVPAEYGDLQSGVIIVETDNPGMRGFAGKPKRIQRREERAAREKAKDQEKDGAYMGRKSRYMIASAFCP